LRIRRSFSVFPHALRNGAANKSWERRWGGFPIINGLFAFLVRFSGFSFFGLIDLWNIAPRMFSLGLRKGR
jgi:hypothetical protein